MGKSIFDLEVGDFLSIYDRDYSVVQVLKIGYGSAVKLNCELKDGNETLWFGARNYNDKIMILGKDLQIDFTLTDDLVTIESKIYKKIDTAQGRAVGTSELGYPRYINMEYYDFASEEDSKYLFIHKSNSQTVAFSGERIINSAVVVYPNPNK